MVFFVFFGVNKTVAKGRSPLQELEVGPRSGPYHLVDSKRGMTKKNQITKQLLGLRIQDVKAEYLVH